jgi:glycine oxidase
MIPQTPPASESIWWATLNADERAELSSERADVTRRNPDLLVVGGGLVGLCIAYFAAEQGASVQLIEAGALGAGASGANAGGIWPNDQTPLHSTGFRTLAFLGRDLWGRLSLRPGFEFDWRVNGFLNVNGERIGPSAENAALGLQNQGYAVQAIDGDQIAQLEPNLCSGLKAGLHLPSEAHLHPLKAAVSLVRAARSRGVGIAGGVAAADFAVRNGRIAVVDTTAGPIESRHVIAATGWSTEWLGDIMRPSVPLRPVSGQLICTEPLPPLLNSAVAGRFLILQLRSGEVVTGGSLIESDSLAPDASLSAEFADAARMLVPALRDVPFTRAWCGIRPGTPDGLPIIDRAPDVENLWLAGGHFKNGVLLAPSTGRLLAEWILSGSRPDDLMPFGLSRFV